MAHLTSFDPPPAHIAVGLPEVDPALAELLQRAHVESGDLIVFDDSVSGDVMPLWDATAGKVDAHTPSWLPNPLTSMHLLPADRRPTYMARWNERLRSSGWYIHPAAGRELLDTPRWSGVGQWFFEALVPAVTKWISGGSRQS
jgi:hypothetical protein